MHHLLPEYIKVPAVGLAGGVTSKTLAVVSDGISNLSLAEACQLASIAVSAATVFYILSKAYYLIKHNGKTGE